MEILVGGARCGHKRPGRSKALNTCTECTTFRGNTAGGVTKMAKAAIGLWARADIIPAGHTPRQPLVVYCTPFDASCFVGRRFPDSMGIEKMKKRHPDQITPFLELPRRRRRDLYVRLRWKITRTTSYYGGKFTSDVMLDEPGRPGLYKQWIDCLFLGGDGLTIWNATIVTATQQFWDETCLLAEERASSLLIHEQEEDGFFREGPFLANGQKYFRMVKREPKVYACLGGLTRREYEEQCEREIIKNEPPVIHESFTIESGIVTVLAFMPLSRRMKSIAR